MGIEAVCRKILTDLQVSIKEDPELPQLYRAVLQRFILGISGLFSGLVIPLPLFTSWLQPFFNVQPFRGLMDIPSRIYTGVITSTDVPYYLAFQFLWAVAFALLGELMLRLALKRLVIQGG